MILLAAVQWPGWQGVVQSVNSLGFVVGVACSFIIFLICLLLEMFLRCRKSQHVLKAKQDDGSELVLAYKALRTHIRMLLEREYPCVKLNSIDIAGGAQKYVRLHLTAVEGLNLGNTRSAIAWQLTRSFKEELGLQDAISNVHVDIEDFKAAPTAPVRASFPPAVSAQPPVVPPQPPPGDTAAASDDVPPLKVPEASSQE